VEANVPDLVEAVVFWGIGPILWASGLWSFMHSTLSLARKVIWAIIVITIGAIIGSVLSINMIRNRFVLLLLALPVLAVIDVQLARSKRSYFFWFRACAFEICTVFGTAAMVRYILDMLKVRAC
jgi:hypothetical protein